ncbi:hypothetical protein P7K49_020741 [Saguinus oedipus]|uniref:Uncharacterized protein n=1 Tax=Saguinus oedipus TaxID=9490 RepID=A0ABQ9UQN4_SAGOE|nr:hypothetical protein P7K49_020741 [Saguinus oedipus]
MVMLGAVYREAGKLHSEPLKSCNERGRASGRVGWVVAGGLVSQQLASPFPGYTQGLMYLSFYLLGQLVDTVWVKKGDQILFSSMFEANITTHIAVIACPSHR